MHTAITQTLRPLCTYVHSKRPLKQARHAAGLSAPLGGSRVLIAANILSIDGMVARAQPMLSSSLKSS